jgi:protocatechuate 3,4-dioxygenase beta subunit
MPSLFPAHSAALLVAFAFTFVAGASAGLAGQAQPFPGTGRGNVPRDAAPTQQEPAGTAAIGGVVVLAGSGAPARRARVALTSETLRGVRSVSTDEHGRYAFPALPAGRFMLSASKPGYLGVTYGQRIPGSGRPGTPLQLEDGQRLSIQLELPRAGVISGIVLDEQGEAVPGTQVRVYRYSMQNGIRAPQQAGSGATDDRGMYRIFGLQPGEYLVGATRAMPALARGRTAPAPGQPVDEDPPTGFAPVYYPGTTVASDGTPVPLAAAEERLGVDFQLQLVPLARVEGTVVTPSGRPNVQVLLIDTENAGVGGGRGTGTDGQGHFAFFNVPPGQYRAVAWSVGGGPGERGGFQGRGRGNGRGNDPSRLWGSADIVVEGRDVSSIVLALQPGLTISGRVEFRGTAQPPADMTSVRVSLAPAPLAPAARQMMLPATGRVDETGRFTIEGVVPGSYRLTAAAPGGWSVESAVVAGQDTLDFPLTVGDGAPLTGGVITLTDSPTAITGVAANAQGQPDSDYLLIVYPEDVRYRSPQSRRVRSVRPATNGTFSVTGLPPGDYRVAPVLDPEPGSWFDPAFLQQLDTRSDRFSLAAGERKIQNVRVGGA